MRIRRADSNQAELVRQLRQIPGVTVAHTHVIGSGFPDILVGRNGKNYLIELKDGKKFKSWKKLTPDEEKFHEKWTGQIAVAETFEDVLQIINSK